MFISRADLLVVCDAKVHDNRRFVRNVVPLSCGPPAFRKFADSKDFGEPTNFPHSHLTAENVPDLIKKASSGGSSCSTPFTKTL